MGVCALSPFGMLQTRIGVKIGDRRIKLVVMPDMIALLMPQVGALIAVGTGIIEPSVIARLLIRGSSQLPGMFYALQQVSAHGGGGHVSEPP